MISDSDAAAVGDGQEAEALLEREGTPERIRAVALRAEELRFLSSKRSVGVARAAVRALERISPELLEPSLVSFTWSIYGSALRSVARLQEAEAALITAARMVPEGDLEAQAEVARRLASLRADQRRPRHVQALVPISLIWGEQVGGRAYGEELVGAGSILIRIADFAAAAKLTRRSLAYLPANGDPYYLGAIYNLACCHLEIAATDADLEPGLELMREAYGYAEAGTDYELRLDWLRGKFLRRQGRLEESLEALETLRIGIEARADGMDQALLMLDLAELHLERGDRQAAQRLALSSFPILKLLRTNPEAYRALQTFHRAAQNQALDSAVIGTVRDRLGAL